MGTFQCQTCPGDWGRTRSSPSCFWQWHSKPSFRLDVCALAMPLLPDVPHICILRPLSLCNPQPLFTRLSSLPCAHTPRSSLSSIAVCHLETDVPAVARLPRLQKTPPFARRCDTPAVWDALPPNARCSATPLPVSRCCGSATCCPFPHPCTLPRACHSGRLPGSCS